jgi:adenylate cyclase
MTVSGRRRRRLAAILAADIAGYARLCRADEEGTHRRLQALQKHVIGPAVALHQGRLVRTMGDGLLIEFASAVVAVRCAIAIQSGTAARNLDLPQDRRLEYRIGIDLGEVTAEDGDVFGECLNIAARLERLAEPGTLLISGAVHEQARGRLTYVFEELGARELKDVAQRVPVFRVEIGHRADVTQDLDEESFALPDNPSVAVLPFVNLSSEPDQDHFAEGLTEDIITGLSRVSQVFVIAHSSMLTYRDKLPDVQRIGRELGIRYLLEGSVRRAGNRLRVSCQLIEAETRAHIWAERYDRPLADFFDLQDEITRSIVASTKTQVVLKEGQLAERRPAPDLRVWDLLKRAWRCLYEATPESLARAEALVRQAIDEDPACAMAHWMLSDAILHRALMGGAEGLPAAAMKAQELARHAISLDDNDENAHSAFGIASLNLGQHQEAIAACRRALEINPNCSIALGLLGSSLIYSGRPDEGIGYAEMAIRSSPRDPNNFFRYSDIAAGHFAACRYRAAIDNAQRAIRQKPGYFEGYIVAAASHALLGDLETARQIAQDCGQQLPDVSIRRVSASYMYSNPADLARLEQGLRLAGLPE